MKKATPEKTNKYTFFWRSDSPFSNWYPSVFYHRIGKNMFVFNCMEQYMMFSKAVLFLDIETGMKIMNTPLPRDQKALGKQVQNFNQQQWDAVKENMIYEGLKSKFTQDSDLSNILLNTGDTLLVEASPTDKIWGIGLDEKDAKKTPEEEWPGQNLLGKALTRLRNDLQAQLKLFNDTQATTESVPKEL